ncbi:MAG: hypothetical protein ACRDZY_18875, partial [Acidimicrobiales bacterium]
ADRALAAGLAGRALRIRGPVFLTGPPVVVELVARLSTCVLRTRGSVLDQLRVREPATAGGRLTADSSARDLDRLLAAAEGRPLVLVVDGPHIRRWQRPVRDRVLAARPDTILVELDVPDPDHSRTGPGIVTYGGARITAEAVADVLLGEPGRARSWADGGGSPAGPGAAGSPGPGAAGSPGPGAVASPGGRAGD